MERNGRKPVFNELRFIGRPAGCGGNLEARVSGNIPKLYVNDKIAYSHICQSADVSGTAALHHGATTAAAVASEKTRINQLQQNAWKSVSKFSSLPGASMSTGRQAWVTVWTGAKDLVRRFYEPAIMLVQIFITQGIDHHYYGSGHGSNALAAPGNWQMIKDKKLHKSAKNSDP